MKAKSQFLKSVAPRTAKPEVIVSKRGLNYLLSASKNPVFDVKRNQVLTETDPGYLDYLIELENNLQRELDEQEERERKLIEQMQFMDCSHDEDHPHELNEVIIQI